MDILVLEDTDAKYSELHTHLSAVLEGVCIARAVNLADFMRLVERRKYDLIIVDLLVPRFKDSHDVDDVTSAILDACRDVGCQNRVTPVIALTAFDVASENNYQQLSNELWLYLYRLLLLIKLVSLR